eukprot:10874880-Karenia_brevis.AAC.1
MKVLGCMVSANACVGDEIEFKVAKATAAFYANLEQLMCAKVNIKIRVRLLHKLVGQCLLYGCETMAWTQTVSDRYDGVLCRFVVRMLRMNRRDDETID